MPRQHSQNPERATSEHVHEDWWLLAVLPTPLPQLPHLLLLQLLRTALVPATVAAYSIKLQTFPTMESTCE
jgi:hypothetical protein